MFEKLIKKLKRFEDKHLPFDPSRFGDPVAIKTMWSPLKGGGANFQTHRLVAINPARLEFWASTGAKLFYLIFLIIGLGLLLGFSLASEDKIILLLFGLVFAITGSCLLYFGTAPVVFDKQTGYFWKGRKKPEKLLIENTRSHFAEINQIHAVQLIAEYCSGKSSYYSYELNLVLEDGARINVIDHGNQNKIREDAAKLSAFLEKPVWDAT